MKDQGHRLSHRLRDLPMNYPEWIVLGIFLLLYAPFLGEPVLRTTGDEKVYIAQALEMKARGSWFLQTLAEQPNYYKGPLHYILIRLGVILFGEHSLWSVLWMNAVGLGGIAFLLTRRLKQIWPEQFMPFIFGLGLVLSPGAFAHMFASQMEIELVTIYGLCLYFSLGLSKTPLDLKQWLWLWLTIGAASWIKSPLHSVLLGSGTCLYALLDTSLRSMLFSRKGIASIAIGTLLGFCAYLIPWYLDGANFFRTYVVRETMEKGPNGVTMLEAFLPNISYQIWPHAFMLGLGCLALAHDMLRGRLDRKDRQLLGMSLAFALPTIVFFAWHPYRSEIYSLPTISAILLWACVGWRRALDKWPRFSTQFQNLWLFATVIPSILVLLLHWRFRPSSDWWPPALVIASGFVLLIQVVVLLSLWRKHCSQRRLAWSLTLWVPSFYIVLLLMKTVGLSDLHDLRQYAASNQLSKPLGFYNVQRFVWSEWGSLNFTAELPVKGLHQMADALNWIQAGHALIVPDRKTMEQLRQEMKADSSLKVFVWKRWQSHGEHSATHNPRQAWLQSNLQLLQGEAYIVTKAEPGDQPGV